MPLWLHLRNSRLVPPSDPETNVCWWGFLSLCCSTCRRWWNDTWCSSEIPVAPHNLTNRGNLTQLSLLTRTDTYHIYSCVWVCIFTHTHTPTHCTVQTTIVTSSTFSDSPPISSFWGLPPWHCGDPWCLRPAARWQITENMERQREGGEKKQLTYGCERAKVSWTLWREALQQASSCDWAPQ